MCGYSEKVKWLLAFLFGDISAVASEIILIPWQTQSQCTFVKQKALLCRRQQFEMPMTAGWKMASL